MAPHHCLAPSLQRRCPETLAHISSTHPVGGGEDARSGSHRRSATSRSRQFKHRVELGLMYGERTRMVLEHAIHEIYNHNASGLYFEELYRPSLNIKLHFHLGCHQSLNHNHARAQKVFS